TKAANTLYLPLDRLLNQSLANEQARGSGSGAVVPTQPQQPSQQQPQQPQQQSQPQSQQQPQAAQPQAGQQQVQAAPVQDARPQQEAVRKIDPRSRENGRE